MRIEEDTTFDVSTIKESRRSQVDFDQLKFGRTFSDHMFLIEYENKSWGTPKIVPYQNIKMSPSSSVLHYGQAIFEGMKAFKGEDGVFLFRPDDNIARFNLSAERMCMPSIPPAIFKEALVRLIDMDSSWIPDSPEGSLYIRPFMYATDEYVGVKPSETYRMIIFTCPVQAYYSGALKVKIETHYTRAAEGGTGYAKCAGNYAMSLYPAKLAQVQGYNQLIWTDAKEHKYIEESGTMNIAFRSGNVIMTPPYSDTILRGITRDSVLTLAKDMGYEVQERKISVDEIRKLMEQGQLDEAFGIGTAATIAPIETIGFEDVDLNLSNSEKWEFSNAVLKRLNAIKRGQSPDNFNWNLKI